MPKTADNVTPTTDDSGWETVVEPFGETFQFANEGDTLIGTLTGKKEVETDDLNNPGEKRTQIVYDVTDENGKKWSVWESHNLKALGDLADGTMVKIEFQGKVPSGKPGQSVKRFAVAAKR